MMDIIKSRDERYERYEALLLERDVLRREAGGIWTIYLKNFGQLITDVFELKVDCIELKKSIAFCQAAANRGEKPSRAKLDRYIETNMAEYYRELKDMIRSRDEALASQAVTPYEAQQCKKLYRSLAKAIHPDLHPEVSDNATISELWSRIVEAYDHLDLKLLKELSVLVDAALKQLDMGEIAVDIPDISERIVELEEEIKRIRNTEPFTLKKLVEDEIKREGRKTELEQELDEYRKYKAELEQVLASFEFDESAPLLS